MHLCDTWAVLGSENALEKRGTFRENIKKDNIACTLLLISSISPITALSAVTFPGPYPFSWLTDK